MASAQKSPRGAFDIYHKHGSALRVNSEVFLQNELREAHYPSLVTWIGAEECDILGFAKAGHASARIDGGERMYTAIRRYQEPARSLDEPEGSVSDSILFAHWGLGWNGQTVPCYKFRWVDSAWQIREYYAIVTDEGLLQNDQASYADQLIKACGTWTRQLHDEVYVYEDGDWVKNKALYKAVSKASWQDVIINPVMKANLIKDVDSFFNAKSTYQQYNIPWKRGIILYGPPGCGKTISIKALMNSARKKNVANLYVKSFKASGCQSDQASIREIFNKARSIAPAMLIFEDLDSLITDELRSFFLNEVDGVEENDGLLIIGSTNHLDRIDTSITKRPSRFDRKYHFKAPSERERLLYCQYWQQKLSSDPAIDFPDEVCQAVATLTEGFTFAYLKEVFVHTLLIHVGGDDHSAVDDDDEAHDVGKRPHAELISGLSENSFLYKLCKQMDVLAEELRVDGRDGKEKEVVSDEAEVDSEARNGTEGRKGE
ncbi:hypothetical protein AUEXF2481DRAFT_40828 [Aureobasidium subglaciale EXF-2481]|uniref:AAA+ ATPase domain-containing protein n=1 Tax=Aureobasidium subglaciale (strain EXF-2481) TaxID=1043005 RepID=A0A074Z7K7_AURSE|nr:uncharacterized protein AUEXF2481DRAFT_40828 [Aureobasidium subglaciale EXF-2481]KEQ94876.1 hypothetical protein AUEXF2481DRAFT_40828 [Aureobasidium subglaciale EXF-2481]